MKKLFKERLQAFAFNIDTTHPAIFVHEGAPPTLCFHAWTWAMAHWSRAQRVLVVDIQLYARNAVSGQGDPDWVEDHDWWPAPARHLVDLSPFRSVNTRASALRRALKLVDDYAGSCRAHLEKVGPVGFHAADP